jgi:uncharacterized protein (DUF1499 family)
MFHRLAIALMIVICTVSCSGKRPEGLGTGENGLAGCPATPNCVSSNALDDAHRIDAYVIRGPSGAAWVALEEEIANGPRTLVVTTASGYLHVEYTSVLMRYVDDAEFQLLPSENAIAVRSASRVGHSDMGVNRKRLESLRDALRTRGVLD